LDDGEARRVPARVVNALNTCNRTWRCAFPTLDALYHTVIYMLLWESESLHP